MPIGRRRAPWRGNLLRSACSCVTAVGAFRPARGGSLRRAAPSAFRIRVWCGQVSTGVPGCHGTSGRADGSDVVAGSSEDLPDGGSERPTVAATLVDRRAIQLTPRAGSGRVVSDLHSNVQIVNGPPLAESGTDGSMAPARRRRETAADAALQVSGFGERGFSRIVNRDDLVKS